MGWRVGHLWSADARAFGAASVGFSQHPGPVNLARLLQRLSVTAGFGWLTGLAVRALRTQVPA